MDERPPATPLLSPARIATQAGGFVVGLALLALIVHRAIGEGDWQRIADAGIVPVALLAACTLASALLNGATFWVTIRPVRPLGFGDLQRLNLVANMLNYAPLRLGAILRVVYHIRLDGLSLIQVGGWFSLIACVLVTGIVACGLATLARPGLDGLWLVLVIGQVAAGGAALQLAAGLPVVARHGRGLDAIARDARAVWGALTLRLADLGMYTARMAVAAWILDIELSLSQTVLLALVALTAGLIPFGRLGFREFCVAAAASRMSMLAEDVQGNLNQLALVESAGEAIVFVPLGAVLLPWLRRRWRTRN